MRTREQARRLYVRRWREREDWIVRRRGLGVVCLIRRALRSLWHLGRRS